MSAARMIALAAVSFLSGTASAFASAPAQTETEADYYRLETIPLPPRVVLEVGGMNFSPDGRMMVCTRRGEIWAFKDFQWHLFATGLDEPMGILPVSATEMIVAQRPELTRVTDTDGDGTADSFETLADDWNYSGHVYEWNFGPVRDREGNLFGTLACWYFPTQKYAQPPYSGWEIRPPAGYTPGPQTAWRGWCYKVTPKGEFVPWATGLRSPNGLGFDSEGELFVTDNQGEYFGACAMHHVTKDAFHGHPNGLFWGPDAVTDAFAIPLEELAQRRKPAAIIFPFGVMGQSAAQPLLDDTAGKFGPFAGQMFIGDQTKSTVMRVSLERVNGEYQGACFPFRSGFQCGNNRLAFAKDGSLFAGQTDRGWGAIGGRPYGLQRVVWNGRAPFEVHSMKATASGFELTFTKPVNAAAAVRPASYSLQRYHYHYHRQYGSPQVDNKPVAVREAKLSHDLRTVRLELPELVAGKVYELHIRDLPAQDGSALLHTAAYYTLNHIPTSTQSTHE